jgi:hypothetical protein
VEACGLVDDNNIVFSREQPAQRVCCRDATKPSPRITVVVALISSAFYAAAGSFFFSP